MKADEIHQTYLHGIATTEKKNSCRQKSHKIHNLQHEICTVILHLSLGDTAFSGDSKLCYPMILYIGHISPKYVVFILARCHELKGIPL